MTPLTTTKAPPAGQAAQQIHSENHLPDDDQEDVGYPASLLDQAERVKSWPSSLQGIVGGSVATTPSSRPLRKTSEWRLNFRAQNESQTSQLLIELT